MVEQLDHIDHTALARRKYHDLEIKRQRECDLLNQQLIENVF
jgi:hypothetical protein